MPGDGAAQILPRRGLARSAPAEESGLRGETVRVLHGRGTLALAAVIAGIHGVAVPVIFRYAGTTPGAAVMSLGGFRPLEALIAEIGWPVPAGVHSSRVLRLCRRLTLHLRSSWLLRARSHPVPGAQSPSCSDGRRRNGPHLLGA